MPAPPVPDQLTAEQTRAVEERLERLPEEAEVLLDRRGQTLYRLRVGDLEVVAKCYALKTFSARLLARLGQSRAARSLRSGRRLLAAGIRTPQPYFHRSSGGVLPDAAVLVTAYQSGRQLPDHLREHPDAHEPLLAQLTTLTETLQRHRFSHGDYHAKNILVDAEGEIIIVDLDGVRRHRAAFRQRRRYRRDRKRMIGSLKDFPEFARKLDAALPPAT